MGTKAKIAAASLVVAGAAVGAYAWLHVSSGDEPKVLQIIASGEIKARVRRCGCQGEVELPKEVKVFFGTCSCKSVAPPAQVPLDLGAFAERSAFQARAGGDPLVVDAGDLFCPHLDPMDFERPEWQRRAELIVDLMERLHLQVFTPGELDFALGRAALEGLAKRAKFTFVAANLRDAGTHLPLFATRTSVVKEGIKVGITGIVDPPRTDALAALLAREKVELSDDVAAVKAEVEALRGEGCQIIVLIAHAPDPVARAIGRSVPGIEVVVDSHAEIKSDATSSFDEGTAYVLPWPGGGVPLRLQLHFTPGAHGVADEPALTQARSWIKKLEKELDQQLKEREAAPPDRAKALDDQIALVRRKLGEYEAQLPRERRHELTATSVPLIHAYWREGHDPGIKSAIEKYLEDVDKLGLDPEAAKKIEAPGTTANGRPDAFAGEAACAKCHRVQAEIWARTKHATAWASLEKSESQRDPDCVRCHSTA